MGVPEVPASLRSWMSAVSEIVRSVNAAEPLARVLTRVADQACELIGFEFCAVMLADERRECLQIAGWSGLTPDYLAQVSDGQGRAVLEWAEQQHHQLMQLVLDEVELPELTGALASA